MSEKTLKLFKPKGVTVEAYFLKNSLPEDAIWARATELMRQTTMLMAAYADAGGRLRFVPGTEHHIYQGYDTTAPLFADATAVSIYDPTGDLDEWLLENLYILAMRGMWLEHPACTRGYCKLQTVAPEGRNQRSGKRVFYP